MATNSGPCPAILETLQPTTVAGRFSVFACDPAHILAFRSLSPVPLHQLRNQISEFPRLGASAPLPYCCGWFGFIGYEAGTPRLVASRASSTPVIRFGLYDHLLLFDHWENQWWACGIDWGNFFPARPPVSKRLETVRQRLFIAANARNLQIPAPDVCIPKSSFSRVEYRRTVQRVLRYIESGDVYQVNLAQRFCVDTELTPFELYRRARLCNPASYAAFLSWGDEAVISASPELFLELRGGHVITRPIKGTRPRSRIDSADSRWLRELSVSAKEQSELNMIIDLLRNDLGRVCKFGSVHVTDTGSIEEHPTVFHRVASLEGTLAEHLGWADLLGAAFPGGSITGAPKIRAMQIIRELEPFARGPYCGTIGWIGLDGNMTMNIAIRTMFWKDHMVDVMAGGGIVAESDPEAEYDEILAKAAGLLASLNAATEPAVQPETVGAA